MTDVRRTVSIDLETTDKNTLKTLSGIADKFADIGKGFDAFSKVVDSFVSKLSGVTVPASVLTSINALKTLDGVKLPSLSTFVKGLEKLSQATNSVKNLSPIVDELKKFNGIDVPKVAQLANGLEKLSGSTINVNGVATVIKGLIGPLERLAKINIPNVNQIAEGLSKISGTTISSSTSASITVFVSSLKALDGIKIPNFKTIANGILTLSNLTDLPKATANLQALAVSLNSFKNVKIPAVFQLAQGFKQLTNLDVQKITQNINDLAKAISILEKSGTLKNFTTLAQDLRTLQQQLVQVAPQLQSLSSQVSRVGQSFDDSGKKAKGFGERLTNYIQYRVIADTVMKMQDAFFGAITVIKDFDQSLKDLQAITGATNSEVAVMGEKIISVAKNTKFSASEVAAGMVILGQAGLSASETVNTIAAVSDLATGTLSDMSTSVDLVSTAMSVFEISADRASYVSDVFANAINKSKLDVDKLRTALNYVGPVAQEAGVSFEEVSASMMTLANSGQRASTIGTGLRRLFSDLVDPPEKLAAAVGKAGLSLTDLDPRIHSLSTVLTNLNLVVHDSQQAFDIFGRYGANAVLALKGADSGFAEMLRTVSESGTAARMAAVQVEGLGVIFKNLKDRVEILGISLGNAGISDILRNIGKGASFAVERMDMFINSSVGGFITKSALFILAGTSMLAIFSKLVVGIQAVSAVYAGNAIAGMFLIRNGAMITAAHVSIANAFRAIVPNVGAAIAAFESFIVTGGVFGTLIGGFLAPLLAIGGYLIYATSKIDDFKESSEKAIQEAAKFETLQGGLQAYNERISGLTEGSKELKEANIALRTELLKVAESNVEVAVTAMQAANSINPFTGEMEKSREALERYNKQVNQFQYDKVVSAYRDAVQNIQSQSEGLNRFWNSLGSSGIATWKKIEGGMSALFNWDLKELDKSKAKIENFSNEAAKSLSLSKGLQEGKVSMEKFAKYFAELDSIGLKNLSSQGTDLYNAFRLLEEGSSKFLVTLINTGKISLETPVEELQKIAEKAGISSVEVEALVLQFNKMKDFEPGKSIGQNLVEEFSNGTGKVEEFTQKYIELGGTLSDIERQQIVELEKTRKALADNYVMIENNYNMRKQMGIGDIENNKQRAIEEEKFNQKVRELNVEGYENFKYTSIQKVITAQEESDKQLEILKNRHLTEEQEGKNAAQIQMELQRKITAAMESVYNVSEVKEQYQTKEKALTLSHENQLHSIALFEAAETFTQEQAEKERFASTLEMYDKKYSAAVETQKKIDKAEDTTDKHKSDALQKTIDIESQRQEFIRKALEKSVEAEKKASDKIVDLSDKKIKEIEKNETEIVKDKTKYSRDIQTAEHTLSNKIHEINRNLNDKLKDLGKKRLENERKTRSDIEGIYQDAEDRIKGIKQRGMSDSQKEADNFKTYNQKLEQGTKLVSDAEKSGNSFMLGHGQDLLKSAMDIGGAFENEKKAIEAVRQTANKLAEARRVESKIVNDEITKEATLARNTATDKLKMAKDDATFKIAKIKEVYAETTAAEVTRHSKEMENLNKEVEKWQKKLEIAKAISNSATSIDSSGATVPSTSNTSTSSATSSKTVNIDSSKIIAENQKAQDSIKKTSDTYQKEITTANEKIVDSAKYAKESIGTVSESVSSEIAEISKNGFQKVVIDGKEIFTNLTESQIKMTQDIAKAMVEAGNNANSVFSVENVKTDGIQSVKDGVADLVTITQAGASLTIGTEDALKKIEEAKTNIASIPQKEQEVKVDVKDADGNPIESKIEEVKTSAGNISEVKPEIIVQVTKEEFDKLFEKLETLKDSITLTIVATIENEDKVKDLVGIIDTLSKTESKPIITAEVNGNDALAVMNELIDRIKNKLVDIIVNTGNSITELQNVIRYIEDVVSYDGKTVDIYVKTHQSGGTPTVELAKGGSVHDAFKRLSNRFITAGGGTKDDVPAMLKKGEFVHTDKAVDYYGVDFMDDINHLRIPKFNTGGIVDFVQPFVQKFSKGGSVISSTISSMKKKLEDMLGIKRDESSSDVTLNVNNMISNSGKEMKSSIGSDSINSIKNAFNNTVQSFSTGGSTATDLLEAEKAKLLAKYDSQIKAASSSGNEDVQKVLEDERLEILKLTSELEVKLEELKVEYESYVAERTAEYDTAISEIEDSFKEDYDGNTEDHDERVKELDSSYVEDMADLADDKESTIEDYEKTINDFNKDRDSLISDFDSEKESLQIKSDQMATEANRIGLNLAKLYKDLTKKTPQPYETESVQTLNFPTFEQYSKGTMDWDALIMDRIQIEDSYQDRYLPVDKEDPDFDSIRSLVDDINSLGYMKSSGDYSNAILAVEDLKSSWNSDNYANKINDYNQELLDYENEKAEYDNQYATDLDEISKSETETNDEYNKDSTDENDEYSKYVQEATDTKDEDLLNEKTSFDTDLGDNKTTYEDAVNEAKKSYEDSYFSAVEKAANEIASALNSTTSSMSGSASVAGVNTSSNFNMDSLFKKIIASSSKFTSPIEELLKKFKVKGYNSGGFVQPTAYSTPGEDSILASLTPKEYVIPDKVVDFFGKEFFDDILRFKVNGYNTGGLVGNIPTSSYKDNVSSSRHSLDINMMDESYGPFYGQRDMIEEFITGMQKAKMRASR